MNKRELLLQCMASLRAELAAAKVADPWLAELEDSLDPLFSDIGSGLVEPPCCGRFRNPFHIEDPRYGPETRLFAAAAAFRSALEDSASQPWFKSAFGGH
jgi:hypothetical protein